MRIPTLFALMALAGAALVGSELEPPLPEERVITIEYWRHRGQDADVWTVLSGRIVMYRFLMGGGRCELIAEFPVDEKAVARITGFVQLIPSEVRSRVWLPRGVADGISLRVSFTANGGWRDDRIEVENHWRPELAALIEEINRHLPSDRRITFKDDVATMEVPEYLPIVAIPIEEYYRVPADDKAAQPGATDKPDDAQRVRED